jgi:hypothetical protein
MGRSMADVLKEEGALKKSQETLLRQLKRRFGDVPAAVSATRVAGPSGHRRRDAGRRGHRHARLVLGRQCEPRRAYSGTPFV